MINQRHCPFCRTPAIKPCTHLALAVEGRDFVRHCVERCHGQAPWHTLCQQRQTVGWAAGHEDFTWLETAFCDEFLRHLRWFGGMDYEWRTGPKPGQGGFWVLLWSKAPQQLWWELREELERRTVKRQHPQDTAPGMFWLTPH